MSVSRDGHAEATTSKSPLPYSSNLSPIFILIPKRYHSMTAGAGAGFVSSFITCPLDVVKTRLQAQHTSRDAKHYEGVQLTISRIWRQAGFRGFYRGLGPTVAGYLPTWGIYFTVYDMVKDRLGRYVSGESVMLLHGGLLADVVPGVAQSEAETTALHIFAAMSAGATGTLLTNPLWVVKTRFMVGRNTS